MLPTLPYDPARYRRAPSGDARTVRTEPLTGRAKPWSSTPLVAFTAARWPMAMPVTVVKSPPRYSVLPAWARLHTIADGAGWNAAFGAPVTGLRLASRPTAAPL